MSIIEGNMQRGGVKLGKRLYLHQLYEFSFILYLCFPAIKYAFNFFLAPFGLTYLTQMLALVLVYAPILLCAIKKGRLTGDFWLLMSAVLLFFLFTYLLHPEYKPWYTRDEYGVMDYVLSPENGLYIYLMIRCINNPNRILRCIKLGGWPMFLYYTRQVMKALARGYWIDTTNKGYEIHLSYNLSLGYSVLLFTLVFLYCALENKRLSDWVGAGYGLLLILAAGSRGPILDILIFFAIYILNKLGNSRRKVIAVCAVSAAAVVLYLLFPYLLMGISFILSKFGTSSRFISKLLNGTISDDAGRLVIWNAALDMIKEKPLGYGAMGSRHVMQQYVYVAHPHNFFLEVLIDFGVIFGSAIIIWLLYWAIKLLSIKNCDAWRGVFLVFFSRACQLLLSLTYWHSIGLWGALAVGVCMWQEYKKKRRIQNA